VVVLLQLAPAAANPRSLFTLSLAALSSHKLYHLETLENNWGTVHNL